MFGLLAAGLWVAVVISMVLVRRSSPGHPFSSIRRFRKGNRALASSTEAAADYEPSLFGSGPWPMESPRDLPETDRPEPAVRSRSAPPPRAQDPPPPEIHTEQTPERHEEDVEVIETRRRRRKPREANYVPTLGDRLLAEAEAEAEAAARPGEQTGQFPAASQPIAAEAPAAQPTGMTPHWGPSRRGLLRRRKTEDDLLSPAFARQTEEPKLVVKLGKPQDEEPPPPVAPGQRSRTREPKPRRIDVSDRALAAGSPQAPRIITVAFEDEPEEEAPAPAPAWVQRVVPMPPSQVVQMPELPEEIEEEDAEAQGLLASALLRASEAPLEGTPPARPQPAAAPPPGSMPAPLPFIRGIGRTRDRVTVPGGIPPPVVHIQTIHLDDEGDPVIVTEEEAAETAAHEAALLEVTEVETLIELDIPPLDTPAMETHEAIEPPDAATGPEPSAAWEPELPADAPWFHDAGAAHEQADPDRPEAFWDDASLDDLSAEPEGAGTENLVPPAEAAAPSPETEREDAESPARRVARPAPIDLRAGRRAARSTGPEGESPRARRPGAHRGGTEERDPNSVTLSTGSAVRPRVTVNLTEQDIEDSDELYEVEALLDAITRDPKKKRRGPFRGSQPAPPEPPPMSSHVIRRERPAGGSTEIPSPAASSAPPSPSPAAPSSFPKGEVPTPPIRRPAPDARPAPRPELRPQMRLDSRPVPRPEFRPQAPSERRPATGAAPVVLPRSAWEERLNARASGASAPGTNGAHKPGAREPARQPEPKAARRARGPVTLILVDDEGRPQSD
jgi:hypothetical protein